MTARTATFKPLSPRRTAWRFTVWFLALGELRRQRLRLSELDGHLLDDIGATPDEALREASRFAWDVPAHWLR